MRKRFRKLLVVLLTMSLVVLLVGTLVVPNRPAYAVVSYHQATLNLDQPHVAAQYVLSPSNSWSTVASQSRSIMISQHDTAEALLALVSGAGSNAPRSAVGPQADAGITCSARAFGASAAGTLVGDSGQLPASGGDMKGFAGLVNLMGSGYSLVAPTVPGAAAMSHVVGCSPSILSTATMLNFQLNVGGTIVSADTVQAQISGQCSTALSGQTFITGLKVNGVALAASFDGSAVNATMALPNGGGTLTVNEESGGGSTLTVNAIHIHTTSGQDFILGGTQASLAGCVPATNTPTSTNTATATATLTPTNTPAPTSTATVVPPSATVTVSATSAPATSTSSPVPTATNTAALPTATSMSTSTPVPATATSMPTMTPIPFTATPIPSTATSTSAPVATNTPTSTTAAVSIEDGSSVSDFKFSPATLNISVGTKVTWTNNSSTNTTHTTTSDTGNASGGIWDSGFLAPGQSFSFTFNTAGTFTYHCAIHPFMTGTIHVS